MRASTEQALQLIEKYRSNRIIMKWVTSEAIEKTASDFNKSVEQVIMFRKFSPTFSNRVDKYINAGLVGCLMAANIRIK